MQAASPSNDYLSNLHVVERFPFSLHGPIRSHVLQLIEPTAAGGRTLSILNVGCGLSQILKNIRISRPDRVSP